MAADTNGTARELLAGAFGFDRGQSAAHFLVHISEHLSWNTERVGDGRRRKASVRRESVFPNWSGVAVSLSITMEVTGTSW